MSPWGTNVGTHKSKFGYCSREAQASSIAGLYTHWACSLCFTDLEPLGVFPGIPNVGDISVGKDKTASSLLIASQI